MPGLVRAARWEMIILLGGLMVVVLSKVLAGGINMSGLLEVKRGDDQGSFSPGRAQMMMATLLAAMYYLLQVINNPSADSLPDAPATLVGVLGGSHAIYLGGKLQSAWHLISGKRKQNDSK
jgi:hypothetical protein